jgi:hypothetical protein
MRVFVLSAIGVAAAVVAYRYRDRIRGAIMGGHFSLSEFRSRGRDLAAGTAELYQALADRTLEPARAIAAEVAGGPVVAIVISGQRLPDHNAAVGGAVNSYHLPPQARPDPARRTPAVAADLRFKRKNGEALSGAEHAAVAARVIAAMQAGTVPQGGVQAYHTAPGGSKTPFVHFDNRGKIATWE